MRLDRTRLALAVTLTALTLLGCGDRDETPTPPAPEPAAKTLQEEMETSSFRLSTEMRELIWDAEHLALVLSQDFNPIVRGAFRGTKSDRFASLVSDDFQGQVFSGEGATRVHGAIAQTRWEATDPRKAIDKAGLVAWFRDVGASFKTIEKIGFHTTTVRPEEPGKLDGRWEGAFDVHVQGILPDGSRSELMFLCTLGYKRLAKDIIGQDGWLDRFETQRAWRVTSRERLLVDVTETSGIDTSKLVDNWRSTEPPFYGVTGGLHAIDANVDGRVDLLINDMNGFFFYEQTEDGRFEDATQRAGLAFSGGEAVRSVIPGDFNGDGREDLMLLVSRGSAPGEVRLYENREDGTFARVARGQTGLEGRTFANFDGVVADYDGDGVLDVYVIKAGAPAPKSLREARWIMDQTSPEGLLLRGEGNWRFRDVTAEARMTGKSVDTYGAVWFDHEPDGDPDLFLSNHMGPNVFWRNEGDGTFTSVPLDEGFGGFSMGVSAGDLDDDGDVDLYIANMYSSAGNRVMGHLRPEHYPEGWFPYIKGFILGNELYRSDPDGMKQIGIQSEVDVGGWAYGPALMDLDGDGRLDIYSPAGFQSVTRGEPDG